MLCTPTGSKGCRRAATVNRLSVLIGRDWCLSQEPVRFCSCRNCNRAAACRLCGCLKWQQMQLVYCHTYVHLGGHVGIVPSMMPFVAPQAQRTVCCQSLPSCTWRCRVLKTPACPPLGGFHSHDLRQGLVPLLGGQCKAVQRGRLCHCTFGTSVFKTLSGHQQLQPSRIRSCMAVAVTTQYQPRSQYRPTARQQRSLFQPSVVHRDPVGAVQPQFSLGPTLTARCATERFGFMVRFWLLCLAMLLVA
jgi:hypothetical protein